MLLGNQKRASVKPKAEIKRPSVVEILILSILSALILAAEPWIGYGQSNVSAPVTKFSCFVQAVTVTTQCQAAPAAGLRAYVTDIALSNEAATVQTLDVVFGTSTNCGTGTTALTHKFQMGTNATTTSPQLIDVDLVSPLVPTAANAICVRPSAATAFGATLTGYIAP